MLFLIEVTNVIFHFLEGIPAIALLFIAPIAIIALATVATAIATFIEQQVPAGDHH